MSTIARGVAAFSAEAGAVVKYPTAQNMAAYVGRRHLRQIGSIKPQRHVGENTA